MHEQAIAAFFGFNEMPLVSISDGQRAPILMPMWSPPSTMGPCTAVAALNYKSLGCRKRTQFDPHQDRMRYDQPRRMTVGWRGSPPWAA